MTALTVSTPDGAKLPVDVDSTGTFRTTYDQQALSDQTLAGLQTKITRLAGRAAEVNPVPFTLLDWHGVSSATGIATIRAGVARRRHSSHAHKILVTWESGAPGDFTAYRGDGQGTMMRGLDEAERAELDTLVAEATRAVAKLRDYATGRYLDVAAAIDAGTRAGAR